MPKKGKKKLAPRKNARDKFNKERAAERRRANEPDYDHEQDEDSDADDKDSDAEDNNAAGESNVDAPNQPAEAGPSQVLPEVEGDEDRTQETTTATIEPDAVLNENKKSVETQTHSKSTEEKGVQVLELLKVRICQGTQTSRETKDQTIQLVPSDLGLLDTVTQTFPSEPDNNVVTSLDKLNLTLRSTLSPVWTTSCYKGEQLQVVMIENISGSLLVMRGLMFSKTDFNITICGRQLLNNHAIVCSLQQQKEEELEKRKNEKNVESDWIFTGEKIKNISQNIERMKICTGINNFSELWSQGVFSLRGVVDTLYCGTPVYRTKTCQLLLENKEKSTCLSCRTEQTNMLREKNKRAKKALLVTSSSKNIKYMQRHELEASLKEARKEGSKHRRQIKNLRKKVDELIKNEGTSLSKGWSETFKNVNRKNFEKMSDIQKLFWDQQLKAASLKRKSSMVWHPMMIRLAINFEMHSNPEKIRGTECVFLPSKRTLFDYTHAIDSQVDGCQKEILEDFRKELDQKCKAEHERFCSLMFDEMHVRSNLVYSKSRQELVGYANLNSIEEEFRNLEAEWTGSVPQARPLAKKVLVFMIRNITAIEKKSQMRGVVAIYPVPSSMSASSLYTRLWDVMYCCESANIPIISIVCDGASTNRSCLKMHPRYQRSVAEMDFDDEDDDVYEDENDVVFCTTNLASSNLRPLYFIIDPPHLLKTIRNAFANSFCHKKSRRLWNKEIISWKLITEYFHRNKTNKFRKSTITSAHVHLTSFSVMKVSYAAQVMSNTLSKAIKEEGEKAKEDKRDYPPFQAATTFMKKTNDLFDSMNGHNISSGTRYRNDNLKPYCSKDDPRFKNVMMDYLNYLEDWKENVMTRAGNYNKGQRAAMMMPHQTISGLRITVFGMKGAIKYLLKMGASAICARTFCQDPLEQTFSIFRSKGGSNNSLDVQQVNHARIKLHAQRQTGLAAASIKGNTEVEKSNIEIDVTPLPKRRKKE